MGLIYITVLLIGGMVATWYLEKRDDFRGREIKRLLKEEKERRQERERRSIKRRMQYTTAGLEWRPRG